jgi:TIR domain
MRVFLSWSGEQSRQVALILKEWLPTVIQALDTWVSSADIDKGASWLASITDSLVKAEGVGVFCLTADNLKAPWLAYEAGALASHDQGRVARSFIVLPLLMFQLH